MSDIVAGNRFIRWTLFIILLGVLLGIAALVTACDRPPNPKPPVDSLPPDSGTVDSSIIDDPSDLDEIRDSGRFLDSAVSARLGELQARYAAYEPPVAMPGLAFGASGWNREDWCQGSFSGTFVAAPPGTTISTLERAKDCNVRIMFVVPRRLQTVNETSPGRFSSAVSIRTASDYARYLTQLKAYVASGYLAGIIVLDDMGCAPCWGGTVITHAQAEEAYKAWKEKLPGVPIGIRVVPNWIKTRPSLAQYIDFAWAQYVMVRGEYRRYYETAWRDAQSLNIRLAGGINVYHFSEPGSGRAIQADELRAIGTYLIDQPWPCFGVSWMAWDGWQSQGREAVWKELVAKAKAKTNVPSCLKGG